MGDQGTEMEDNDKEGDGKYSIGFRDALATLAHNTFTVEVLPRALLRKYWERQDLERH